VKTTAGWACDNPIRKVEKDGADLSGRIKNENLRLEWGLAVVSRSKMVSNEIGKSFGKFASNLFKAAYEFLSFKSRLIKLIEANIYKSQCIPLNPTLSLHSMFGMVNSRESGNI
jgi:hypothetical protein